MPSDQPNLQRAAAASPRAQAITDARIMAYIHEISSRHRHADAPAEGAPTDIVPAVM